jgi:hypothetical protein
VGGVAFAHDFAVGGAAWALHANDAAAEDLLLVHPLWRGWQWYLANLAWLVPSWVVLLVLGYIGALRLMYRREGVLKRSAAGRFLGRGGGTEPKQIKQLNASSAGGTTRVEGSEDPRD